MNSHLNIHILIFIMKLLIKSQTWTVAALKFGYGCVIPSHTLLGMWLYIHAEIGMCQLCGHRGQRQSGLKIFIVWWFANQFSQMTTVNSRHEANRSAIMISLSPFPMQCKIFQLVVFPDINIISHAILILTTSRCQFCMDNDTKLLFGKKCMHNTINKLFICPNTLECLAQHSV